MRFRNDLQVGERLAIYFDNERVSESGSTKGPMKNMVEVFVYRCGTEEQYPLTAPFFGSEILPLGSEADPQMFGKVIHAAAATLAFALSTPNRKLVMEGYAIRDRDQEDTFTGGFTPIYQIWEVSNWGTYFFTSDPRKLPPYRERDAFEPCELRQGEEVFRRIFGPYILVNERIFLPAIIFRVERRT